MVVDVLQGLRVDVDVHHGDVVVDCGLHQALEDGCHQIFGVVDELKILFKIILCIILYSLKFLWLT